MKRLGFWLVFLDMLAAVLLSAQDDTLIGRQIFLDPASQVEVRGAIVREPCGDVWRVVGRDGDRFRLVSDYPARVATFPADGTVDGGLLYWMKSRIVRPGDGWWIKYVGKTFWSYLPSYLVEFGGEESGGVVYNTGRYPIRVEAAIPLEGNSRVYLDGASLDSFFNVESQGRVMFVVSFVSDSLSGYRVSQSDAVGEYVGAGPKPNIVNGRLWTSVEVAGQWDAQRHFSEKSLEQELGYSLREFHRKFRTDIKKGMSKRELAWLYGWPHMALSPELALKEDLWSYNNIPFAATYQFKNGKLASWHIPTLP